jgi:hypothetical protein
MLELPFGHRAHVAPVESEYLAQRIKNVEHEWDANEERYFVWVDGVTGRGFVCAGTYEAMIVTKSFLPKKGVLRKEVLPADDERCLGQLMVDYPWPMIKDEVVLVQYAVKVPFPAMFGGMDDAQG